MLMVEKSAREINESCQILTETKVVTLYHIKPGKQKKTNAKGRAC